jgi:hypothetical protein
MYSEVHLLLLAHTMIPHVYFLLSLGLYLTLSAKAVFICIISLPKAILGPYINLDRDKTIPSIYKPIGVLLPSEVAFCEVQK